MTLPAILVVCFLSVGNPYPFQDHSALSQQGQTSSTSPQAPAADSNTPSSQQPPPAKPAKVSRHPKKNSAPDCINAPGAAKLNGTDTSDPGKAGALEQKPCPTPKVVVKNGGSDEPAVQLKGDRNAGPGSSPGSTEDLLVAANENLKKLAERELNDSQEETVNQIKEFMKQAKVAVDEGDLERGHNLAVKARVLSDELLKP